MRNLLLMFAVLGMAFVAVTGAQARDPQTLHYQHSDEYQAVLTKDGKSVDTMYAFGNVIFETDSGMVYCDTAVWALDRNLLLRGKVIIDEVNYRLAADSVFYDQKTTEATARGSYVELWSKPDSLFAVGTHAFYNRTTRYFRMENRPTLYLKYPDSAKMIEVIADQIEYDALGSLAQAEGNVRITSKDLSATAGCAVMHPQRNLLDLFDGPVAQRGRSTLKGSLISVLSQNDMVSRIDVLDSARGDFTEPINKDSAKVDKSILIGKRIVLDFDLGVLKSVTAYHQAYSWYNPAVQEDNEEQQNSVSGDTITFALKQERLQSVTVTGGAVGRYISSKPQEKSIAAGSAKSDSTKSPADTLRAEPKAEPESELIP